MKWVALLLLVASPCAALDFAGDGSGSSLNGTVSISSNATVTGTLRVTGASTLNGGLTISGNPVFSSSTVIDAYSDSFGAVTAGSTSTVTYTEITDRLGEFVTSSFTVLTAGFYEIVAHSGISQTAGTGCLILKNNSVSVPGATVCNSGVTGLASVLDVSLTRILNFAANDIIRIDASATTANATFQKMTLTIKRVP